MKRMIKSSVKFEEHAHSSNQSDVPRDIEDSIKESILKVMSAILRVELHSVIGTYYMKDRNIVGYVICEFKQKMSTEKFFSSTDKILRDEITSTNPWVAYAETSTKRIEGREYLSVNVCYYDAKDVLDDTAVQPTEKRSTRWSAVLSKLEQDSESCDPLYEGTEAGEHINSLCAKVEKKLHLYVEPSIQGGQGGVWIFDESSNDDAILEGYDYQTFNKEIIDIALNSRSSQEFKQLYMQYLNKLID